MTESPSPAPSVVTDDTVPFMEAADVIMHHASQNADSMASALLMVSAIKIESCNNRMMRHAVTLIRHIINTCGLSDRVTFVVNDELD